MWWKRNSRHEASQIRSLMERLKALGDSDFATPAATAGGAVHTTVAAGSPRGLIR